jgi:glycosidase
MKATMTNLYLFLTWLLTSCGKSSDAPPAPPVNPTDTVAQYGTPFAGVVDRQDAVIYQVNMRTFSTPGNFAGVTARLDSIKALGANVVYLMPIYPVGMYKAINSPYCVRDHMAVNPEFGSLNDLRALVDGAHSRNMSVILDFVANHTAWDHVWISAHKDWYKQDNAGNIIAPPGTGWNDVAQINFNNADLRLALIRAMKYWVLAVNIDGYRCDYTDGPPLDFWKQAIDTLRNISTHKLLLLAEGGRSANYTIGFDYNFGFGFFNNLKSIYNSNVSAQSIDNLNTTDYTSASNGQQIVRYITNHDVNGSDGTPLELFGDKKGSMAAFVVVSYMKSVPMIYNGQEVATPVRMTFPFTSTKIDWTINPDVTAEYKKVIAFRNSSNAIRRGTLQSYSSSDICAFTKEQAGEKVLVIANMRNTISNYSVPPALANTTWVDVMKGTSVMLTGNIPVQPYEYLVLKN